MIGFVGQGVVGKAIADDMDARGHGPVVRYSLEPEYIGNKAEIYQCDMVFVAVPTPTVNYKVDYFAVESALALMSAGTIAVIKSTTIPGTVDALQRKYPSLFVISHPEFLRASHAAADAAKPFINVFGGGPKAMEKAVLYLMPRLSPAIAGPAILTTARTAEMIKYAHNIHGTMQILFTNIMFDAANAIGADWRDLSAAMHHDPFFTHLTTQYRDPVRDGGRGAGGECFIKDLAAFRQFIDLAAPRGSDMIRAMEELNCHLLQSTSKDIDILDRVHR